MLDPVGGSVARNTGSVASWAVVRATGKRKASPGGGDPARRGVSEICWKNWLN
jgi:hypothetical protein